MLLLVVYALNVAYNSTFFLFATLPLGITKAMSCIGGILITFGYHYVNCRFMFRICQDTIHGHVTKFSDVELELLVCS